MGIEIDSSWTPRRLPVGSRELDGYVRKSGDLTDEYPFKVAHVKDVNHSGGLLFQRFHEPRNKREVQHPGGLVGYQFDLPEIEMWYLPQCSFEESLGLLDTFAFPSPNVCDRPEEVLTLSKNVLRKIGSTRHIALTAIAPEAVSVENVEPGQPFSKVEITGILEFNERHFSIRRSQSESQDLRRLFRSKGFFVLGRM